MAYQDWLYKTSAPIIAASKAAGLTGNDASMVEGLAMLTAKHKQLMDMPADAAQEEFGALTKKTQKALEAHFGNNKYNPAEEVERSFFGEVVDRITGTPMAVLDALGTYGETLSNVYRTARTYDTSESFMENWDDAWDGRKVFDPVMEEKINQAYSPTVLKIAKKWAEGKTYGEILSTLKGQEEFDAFLRFQKGDKEFTRAVRDYDNARISWGRDFAHLFNLEPDVGVEDQGIEGTIYNWVSGGADLIGDIAFDPLTYAGTPLKAIQIGRYGLAALVKAELAAQGVGELSRAQKVLKAFGKEVGVDAAFNLPRVAKVFDDAGSLIKTATSKSKKIPTATKSMARVELRKINPFFDDVTIEELGKAKVFDADSARKFFKDADKMDAILSGRVGEIARQLPRYKVTQGVRNQLNRAVDKVTGYSKNAAAFAPLATSAIKMLEQGESLAGKTDLGTPFLKDSLKDIKNVGDRWARMFERAITDRTVYVGGFDELGRSMRLRSVNTIYTMARVVLPKYHAQVIASAYGAAKDEATARRIITGLFDTIADGMGIARLGEDKRAYNTIMKSFQDAQYGETMVVGDDIRKILGGSKAPKLYSPAQIKGKDFGVAEHHLAKQAVIPDLTELVRILDKNPAHAITKRVNGSFVSTATDFWSALNLLPRLGLRSVIDESLFHYLNMPIAVFFKAFKGYPASITRRILGNPAAKTSIGRNVFGEEGEREIGVLARVFRKFFVNEDPATIQKALKSPARAAALTEQVLIKGKIKKAIIGEQDAKYISDQVLFGHSREIEAFSEGMNKSVAVGAPLNKQFDSSVENFNVNVDAMQKDLNIRLTGEPTLVAKTRPEFNVNFLVQLNNRVDRNGVIGKLAVQYMDKPQQAIDEIAKYFRTPEGKKVFSRFERSALQSPEEAARDMYLHVRAVFQDDFGKLNRKLLKKVRRKDVDGNLEIDATLIGPKDLEEVADMLPSQIFGYTKTVPAFGNIGGFIAALFDRGFQVADRQLATLSREPAFYGYYLHFRKELAPLEEAYAQKLMKQKVSEKLARHTAARRYTFIGNELAMNRVLGFVDNPNVRSNLAFGVRNLARYYRATEDFARRAARTFKPETFVRMRMTNEGLDEAGFLHEDENGETYFFIPVDEISYRMYSTFITQWTGTPPSNVMPLSLTGKVKMLTPSLDPESALPTFGGPLLAVGWQAIKDIVPAEYRSDAERIFFGPYAENRDLMEAITPSVLRKGFETVNASLSGATSVQVQSAAMKAAAYYTSMGMAPGADATAKERAEFSYMVQATARNIIAVRNLIGIFSPVSPTVSATKDVPKELFDEGMTSFKSEFNNLVEAEFNKGGADPYERALRKWTKANPGKLVYTVSETETNRVASIQKTKEAVGWMKRNEKLVKMFPEASLFLVPQNAGFDLSAYAFLKAEGYISYKPLDEYYEQIATVKAETEYRALKDKNDKLIASTGSPARQAYFAQQAEIERKNFLKDKPYLRKRFEKRSGTQIKLDTVTDIREMLRSDLLPESATTKAMRKMVKIFDETYSLLQNTTSQTDAMSAYRESIKSAALYNLKSLVGQNPNLQMLYTDVFERLLS